MRFAGSVCLRSQDGRLDVKWKYYLPVIAADEIKGQSERERGYGERERARERRVTRVTESDSRVDSHYVSLSSYRLFASRSPLALTVYPSTRLLGFLPHSFSRNRFPSLDRQSFSSRLVSSRLASERARERGQRRQRALGCEGESMQRLINRIGGRATAESECSDWESDAGLRGRGSLQIRGGDAVCVHVRACESQQTDRTAQSLRTRKKERERGREA